GANDLSTDLNPDPRLAIFRQTDNGIPVRMAIFAVLLGVETLVPHSLRDVTWSPPTHIGPDDSVFHGMYWRRRGDGSPLVTPAASAAFCSAECRHQVVEQAGQLATHQHEIGV